MTLFLGMVSQKGGVGKSTLARLVAKEYATAGWRVKIADLDIAQGTSFNWQARRLQHALEPTIPVERFGTVEQVLKVAALYDLIIFDCPPNATAGTLKAAQASTCIILPTGLSLDDLEPSILLAHEFIKQGRSICDSRWVSRPTHRCSRTGLESFPSPGSSAMRPLSWVPFRCLYTVRACDLRFRASSVRSIAPSRRSVGLARL